MSKQDDKSLGHGLKGGYFPNEDLLSLINAGGTGVYVTMGETAQGNPALVATSVTVPRTDLVRESEAATLDGDRGGPVLPIVSYPVPPMPVPGGGD